MQVEIDYTWNDVVICGSLVRRPPEVCPSEWLAFWENARTGKPRARMFGNVTQWSTHDDPSYGVVQVSR